MLGEKNQKLDKILKEVYDLINEREMAVKINLIEVKRPYAHAQAICNLVVSQLKDRVRSRQIIKNIGRSLLDEREIRGWTIRINGLIDGSEIGQRKKTTHARMPLSEIDSNIDLGEKQAFMARGVIGVKVLIYKGKIWKKRNHVDTKKN